MNSPIPISKRLCECGLPAVKMKQSCYVCARCLELESRQTAWINRRVKAGEKESSGKGGMTKYNHPDNSPICGESLTMLNL